MSLQQELRDFADGVFNALVWAGLVTGDGFKSLGRHILRTDIEGGATTLKQEATDFYTSFQAPILAAPGIPGLTLADGTLASLPWQAEHDYCLIRTGRWSAFPVGAWGAPLAANMTAVAIAQPRVTINVAIDGTITVTEG